MLINSCQENFMDMSMKTTEMKLNSKKTLKKCVVKYRHLEYQLQTPASIKVLTNLLYFYLIACQTIKWQSNWIMLLEVYALNMQRVYKSTHKMLIPSVPTM